MNKNEDFKLLRQQMKYEADKLAIEKEYNVVIIDDKIINITNTEKVEFEGILKLNHINNF